MSESSSSGSDADTRGVSSPVVVLISVAMFSLALSLYMGYSGSIAQSASADRDVSEPTMERIWTEISDSGAYDKSEGLDNAVSVETLPQGRTVYVAITYTNASGSQQLVEHVKFSPDGGTSGYSDTPLPDHANASSRPIGVRRGPQDVKGARLHVGVA